MRGCQDHEVSKGSVCPGARKAASMRARGIEGESWTWCDVGKALVWGSRGKVDPAAPIHRVISSRGRGLAAVRDPVNGT